MMRLKVAMRIAARALAIDHMAQATTIRSTEP